MRKIFFIIFLAFLCLSAAPAVSAYFVEDLHLTTSGSIIVGPGKTEIMLSPGDTYNFEVLVSNVSGMDKIINFNTEDMTASNKPDEALEFLGNLKGPYSLSDYVKPESAQLVLQTGQRVRMPVTITIPKDAEPGGLYGALMISAANTVVSSSVQQGSAAGQINLITRVASLMFITVKGDVVQSGFLKDFKADGKFYEQGPVKFEITSANTGNIHLDPYGAIEIKDMFGRIIDAREVDPWFVMPKSERMREMAWNSNFLFGKYTATLTMNRGYKDIVDIKAIGFWVIPWKVVVIGLIILILIISFFVWIASHIQWKKEKPANPPIEQKPNPNLNPNPSLIPPIQNSVQPPPVNPSKL